MTATNTPTALSIRSVIETAGAEAAERQLGIIAHEAGDTELALVVQDLLPGEIALIVGKGDYTKPSVIAPFVTPAQFLDALERLGAGWGKIGDAETHVLYTLRNEVTDFVLSIVLLAEQFRRTQLLGALVSHRFGHDILVMLSIGESGCPSFLQNYNPQRAELGTWQELYTLVEETNKPAFVTLRQHVIELHREAAVSSDKVSPTTAFVKNTLRMMVAKAAKLVQGNPAGEEDTSDKKVFDI